MRFSVILALAMAGLTMTSYAQKLQKPKGKPSHSEERENKSARVAKEPAAGRTSAATELRRVEQSSAKVSARKTEGGKAAHGNPVLKAQKKDGNPPIRFSAGGGSGKSSGKSGNELKGRLRHKGRR